MNRRSFIHSAGSVILLPSLTKKLVENNSTNPFIMTVNGPVAVETAGVSLTHEHLFSIFGLDAEEKTEYDIDELMGIVLPFLQQVKAAGCKTIIECTAAYFGRNVKILKILSERSGINIVTNTGIYGAADGRYIPQYAHTETAAQLAKRWINEWNVGIDNTNIRPGFIKLGFNSGQLAAIDKKLLQAGALTHLATGLTIAAHTADNPEAALEQLSILKENNVSPSAWIWTHAHAVVTDGPLSEAAKAGAWISFDGYQTERHERFLQGLLTLKKSGFLHRVLLSHDGNGYPQKGKMPSRLSISLLTDLLPALSQSGFSQTELQQLTVINPGNAFAVKIRKT